MECKFETENKLLKDNIEKLKPFVSMFNQMFDANLAHGKDSVDFPLYTLKVVPKEPGLKPDLQDDAGGYLEISKMADEIKFVASEAKMAKEIEMLLKKYPDVDVKTLPPSFFKMWGEKSILESYEESVISGLES